MNTQETFDTKIECPNLCGGEKHQIATGVIDVDFDGRTGWSACECAVCGTTWQNVFYLCDIVEVELRDNNITEGGQ